MVAESRFRDFYFRRRLSPPATLTAVLTALNTMAPAPFAFGVEQKLNSFAFSPRCSCILLVDFEPTDCLCSLTVIRLTTIVIVNMFTV